jgi:protein O-GlcNAc transferase
MLQNSTRVIMNRAGRQSQTRAARPTPSYNSAIHLPDRTASVDSMLAKILRLIRPRSGHAPIAAPVQNPVSDPIDEQDYHPQVILGLIEAGHTDEAERRLRRRIDTELDDVDALHLLGLLCHQSGRSADALALIGRAVALAPGVAFMQANFAEALRVQGDLDRAEQHAREAVKLLPDHVDFRFNLANVLAALRRHAAVIEVIGPVLAAQPKRVEALMLKADACFELGRADEALQLATAALQIAPGNINLLTRLMRLRAWTCDWAVHPTQREADVTALVALLEHDLARVREGGADAALHGASLRSINPFVTYEYAVPQALREAVTELRAADVIKAAGPALQAIDPATRAKKKRLKIGYVSADFHSHPTMHLMAGFFEQHDRKRFEIFAYSIGADDGSAWRQRARSTVDQFVDIRNLTPRQSAERMRRDGIDILVDLKGFTHDARPGIFALKPAPVRVAWLGYPASTGTGLNDYAIVDHVTAPAEVEKQFGEKLARMPHSYQVNDHRQPVAAVPTRQSLGLPETGFIFACFNHVYKIEPDVFASWMRILARVPGSVLWLYGSNALAKSNLERAAEAQGIAAARLVFGDTLDKPRHLARLACADLFLDTGRINAHTSASDALWAGLPVLTHPGDTFTSRVAASLVTAAGLPQLVCDSMQAYEDTAVRLATHSTELAALRATLKAGPTLPLFDTPRFTRNLEGAFESMWARYLKGEEPASFDVADQDAG